MEVLLILSTFNFVDQVAAGYVPDFDAVVEVRPGYGMLAVCGQGTAGDDAFMSPGPLQQTRRNWEKLCLYIITTDRPPIHTCMHARTRAHTRTHTHTHVCACTRTQTYIHTNNQPRTCTIFILSSQCTVSV